MKIMRRLLLATIVILVVVFVALNAQWVEVKYLIGSRSLPLALICFIALVGGLLLGFLMMLGKLLCLKKEVFMLKHKLKNCEIELKETSKN